jgi:hypothetical protein
VSGLSYAARPLWSRAEVRVVVSEVLEDEFFTGIVVDDAVAKLASR